jgi:hypothetical protein
MFQKFKTSLLAILVIMFSALSTTSIIAVDDSSGRAMTQTERAEAREARLAELKELRGLKLTASRLAIIETRCEKAQDRLASVFTKVTNAQSRRLDVYAKMIEKLDTFLVRFENESFDITDLEAKVLTLKDMIAGVEVLFESHLQYLSDLTEMDCTGDPEGFYTALVEARSTLKDLRAATTALHEYFVDEIRSGFVVAIQAVFGSDSTDDTEQAGDTTDTGLEQADTESEE